MVVGFKEAEVWGWGGVRIVYYPCLPGCLTGPAYTCEKQGTCLCGFVKPQEREECGKLVGSSHISSVY